MVSNISLFGCPFGCAVKTHFMRLILLVFVILLSCQNRLFSQQTGSVGLTDPSMTRTLNPIDTQSIWKIIRGLAHDSMMGRRPGTPGEVKTIHYLSRVFKEAGLTPAYPDGYLQPVGLINASATGTINFTIQDNSLNIPDSLLLIRSLRGGDVDFKNKELVFAGYGVTAPEFGWDDYKGIDVKGKMVVILDGEPRQLQKRGFGGALTYHSFYLVKDEIAKRHGAAGIILLMDIKEFSPSLKWWQQKDFTTLAAGLGEFQTHLTVRLSQKAADQFAVANHATMEAWKRQADDSSFNPFSIPALAQIAVHTQATPFTSHNVVGFIRGSDPVLRNECIVYSTHWDGYGIGPTIRGDSIYNAAKDNAGGIAEMLTIAHAMHTMSKAPRRSIVFIASTAEESGKLGAEAYTRSPLFPLNKTVLAIGMDIFSPWGHSVGLYNAGYGYTSVDTLLGQLAREKGVPYKAPRNSQFAASDQYMFARRGVPAIFATMDSESYSLSKNAIDSIENVSRVHSPFDEIFTVWDLRSVVDEAKVMFQIGVTVANASGRPSWVVRNEFTKK